MSDRFMIYGATGYTGKLIARTAKARGLNPLLAGRNEARLKSIAAQHGFEYQAISLDEPEALDAGLAQVDAVLHIVRLFVFRKNISECCFFIFKSCNSLISL